MTNTLTMSALYEKLKNFGIPQNYVKENGLPSWWDEELNDKPVAVNECSGYIAKRFGLDLKSLLNEDDTIQFSGLTQTLFKQRANNQKSEIAHSLANRFAEMVAYGYEGNFTGIPDNVDEIRAEILQTHSTINLTSLINYCWLKGIAVAHFNQFPQGKTKFDGMIQLHNNQPVIILAINYKESPLLAFTLAHELGHLALGHITEGELFDDKIEPDSNDNEEKEANQFAVKLLLGDCDNCFGDKKFHNKDHLIKKAEEIVSENPTVDIGSIILNNAWHNDNWGFAKKAFKKLYSNDDGQKLINQSLANKLNWDAFDDDSYEYLAKKIDDYDEEETENDNETIVDIDWETVKNQWESEIYNIANYSVTDVSRYLNIPLPILKTWLNGHQNNTIEREKYVFPLIQRPSADNAQLSFTNLVEAHILKVIYNIDNIPLDKVRITLDYLSEKFNTNHPLATKKFSTDGVDLFIERLENLVNLSHSQQLEMKEILQRLLTRVEWNENNFATRLYPELEDTNDEFILIIDPHISFGKPTIKGTGVPTKAIAQLYDAGDSIEEIAEDYNCKVIQIEKAILFESYRKAPFVSLLTK